MLRRVLSLFYESVLLFAVWWAAGSLFVAATQGVGPPWMRAVFQIYLLSIALAYFACWWLRGGQTWAIKTWRIRVVAKDGSQVTFGQTLLRFALAALGIGLAGAGLIWAFFDSDRQFLHDRLAGTKIVRSDK